MIKGDFITIHVKSLALKFSCVFRIANFNLSCDFINHSIVSLAVRIVDQVFDMVVFKSKAVVIKQPNMQKKH